MSAERYWTWHRFLGNAVGLFVWVWVFSFVGYVALAGDYDHPLTTAERAHAHRSRLIAEWVVGSWALAALLLPLAYQPWEWRVSRRGRR